MTGAHLGRGEALAQAVERTRRGYRRAKAARWALVCAVAGVTGVWAPWWGVALVACLVGTTLVAAVVEDRREWEYRLARQDVSRAVGEAVGQRVTGSSDDVPVDEQPYSGLIGCSHGNPGACEHDCSITEYEAGR